MGTTVTVWNGTFAELCLLRTAIERNCTCAWSAGACTAHCLLLDQRTLDRLLFVLRTVEFYVQGEETALRRAVSRL